MLPKGSAVVTAEGLVGYIISVENIFRVFFS